MFLASTVTSPAKMLPPGRPLLRASREPGPFSVLGTHSVQLPGPLTWRVDRRAPADLRPSEVSCSLRPGQPLGALQSLDSVSRSLSPGWKPRRLKDVGPCQGKGVTCYTSLWSRDSAKQQSARPSTGGQGTETMTHTLRGPQTWALPQPCHFGGGGGPPKTSGEKGDEAGSP